MEDRGTGRGDAENSLQITGIWTIKQCDTWFFWTLFPTRSREKNNLNLLHFYGTLQLENHMNIHYFLYPGKICIEDKTVWLCTFLCFIHLHTYIFYKGGKNRVRHSSKKDSMSTKFRIRCPYMHWLDTKMNTYISENSFPKVLQAYWTQHPFLAQNLLISLNLIQTALAWRFSSITLGRMILNKIFTKWHV